MNKKEIIICILAIVMLIVSISNVFAMDLDGDELSADGNNNSTISLIDGNENNTGIQNISNSSSNNYTIANVNNSNSLNNSIPNTGITDTPIIPIVICIISAVVAYTQIRKYNV